MPHQAHAQGLERPQVGQAGGEGVGGGALKQALSHLPAVQLTLVTHTLRDMFVRCSVQAVRLIDGVSSISELQAVHAVHVQSRQWSVKLAVQVHITLAVEALHGPA